MKPHIQNATPRSSRSSRINLRETIFRLSRIHKGLTSFPSLALLAGVLCRAERANISGGRAERKLVRLPLSERKKERVVAHAANGAKRSDEHAKRSARRVPDRVGQRDDASTIATAHLYYHGNGVWSSSPQRPG